MKSEQLAEFVVQFIREAINRDLLSIEKSIAAAARSRIMGTGHEQYSEGDKQKFELVPIDKLLEMAEEECVDQINYGAMALVRIRDEGKAMGFSEHTREIIEDNCLDLIEQGVRATERIRVMREILSNARYY